MPHIHNGVGQHDFTADAFIVNNSNPHNPKILLHKHVKLNKLLQPGGHIELNEDPWSAVVHEMHEETGYEISQLKILQPAMRIDELTSARLCPVPVNINTHQIPPLDHFHTAIQFAFLTDEEPKHKPQEGESTDLGWFSTEQLLQIPAHDIPENVREVALFVLENFSKMEALPAVSFC